MDVSDATTVPRAVLDAAAVQRHRFAAELLRGRDVGVLLDADGHAAEELRAHGSRPVAVALAEPIGSAATSHDALVCLEGIDVLGDADRERLLDRLARFAADGGATILALPNTEAFPADDPSGAGYERALEVLARFPGATLMLQAPAEGSLLRRVDPAPDQPLQATLALPDQLEPELATAYVCVSGVGDALDAALAHADLRLAVAPTFTRRLRNAEAANAELVRENVRLGRGLVGRSGAGAVATLTRLRGENERVVERAERAEEECLRARAEISSADDRTAEAQARADALEARLRATEARLRETEVRLGEAAARAADAEALFAASEQRAEDVEARVVEVDERARDAEDYARRLERELDSLRNRRALRIADRVTGVLRRR